VLEKLVPQGVTDIQQEVFENLSVCFDIATQRGDVVLCHWALKTGHQEAR
jgi:hypothetical protein